MVTELCQLDREKSGAGSEVQHAATLGLEGAIGYGMIEYIERIEHGRPVGFPV